MICEVMRRALFTGRWIMIYYLLRKIYPYLIKIYTLKTVGVLYARTA